MEHTKFAEQLKYLSANGVTLNVEERMNVALALAQLQNELGFERLHLWGKVEGKYFYHFSDSFRLLNRLLRCSGS